MPCTTKNKWCGCVGVSLCFGVILIVIGIALPILLDHKIKDEANKQTVMTADNYEMWGEVPGKTGAVIIRNFTFFDFVNPMDVMFRNQKPKFVEVGPYMYQELQNFTKPVYSEDGSLVDYKYWVHTVQLDKQDTSRKIRFANFVALGAWYQMNNVEPALMTLQTFGQLIYGMEALILPNILGVAVQSMTYNTYDKAKSTLLKDLTDEHAQFIYNDPLYGIGNQTLFSAWINAAQNGDPSGSSDLLRDYFYLSYSQIQAINQQVRAQISNLYGILQNYYCVKAPGAVCTSRYLTAAQWSQSAITYNPPPIGDVKPVPSVIIGNNTGFGYPEISYFYTDYFLPKINGSDPYKGLVFDVNWAMKLLNHSDYTLQDRTFYSDPSMLLNIGNMRYLYDVGGKFDTSKDVQYLVQIQTRFLLDSPEKAHVFWAYVKYIGTEFGQQTLEGGNTATASMGGVISQTLAEEYNNLVDQLLSRIISELLFKQFPTCDDVLKMDDLTDDQKTKFCARDEYKTWTMMSISQVVMICDEPQGDYWTKIYQEVGFTTFQLQQLCDPDQPGFGQTYAVTHQQLHDKYQCTSFATRCSMTEIALKQWLTGEITLNPPSDLWKPAHSAHDVYPDLFENPSEYHWFYDSIKDVVKTVPTLTLKQASYLLSYDCLLSATMVMKAFLDEKKNDLADFKIWFIVDEFNQLNHYLRYLMVQIPFGGLAQERTVNETLYGYNDPLLVTLAQMDPQQGGDPSIPYKVGLNMEVPVDMAVPQQMYTGKNDSNFIRRYSSVNGLPYLTVPQPYFDGQKVGMRYPNPWKVESPLNVGTDAFCFHPNVQEGEDLTVVVTDLVRSAPLKYVGKEDYFGLELFRTELNDSFFELTDDFHNTKWKGLVNFTSVQSAPVFNSFAHFLNADPKLQDFVEIYKYENLTAPQFASEFDKSYVTIEPITGVALKALLNLQINVEYQSDLLFPGTNYAMMPVLWIYRGANFTEDQVNDNYGPLRMGLKAKTWSRWVGLVLGIVLVLGGIALYWFKVRKLKDQNPGRSLSQSLVNAALPP